jgi:hypothetical protein
LKSPNKILSSFYKYNKQKYKKMIKTYACYTVSNDIKYATMQRSCNPNYEGAIESQMGANIFFYERREGHFIAQT